MKEVVALSSKSRYIIFLVIYSYEKEDKKELNNILCYRRKQKDKALEIESLLFNNNEEK